MEVKRITPSEIDHRNLAAEFYVGVCSEPLTDAQKSDIESLLADGVKQVDIARSLGLPIRRIHDYLYNERRMRRKEIPLFRPRAEYDLARQMWEEGKTTAQIAAAYGYSVRRMYGVIEYYRKAFGLFPNRIFKKKPG